MYGVLFVMYGLLLRLNGRRRGRMLLSSIYAVKRKFANFFLRLRHVMGAVHSRDETVQNKGIDPLNSQPRTAINGDDIMS